MQATAGSPGDGVRVPRVLSIFTSMSFEELGCVCWEELWARVPISGRAMGQALQMSPQHFVGFGQSLNFLVSRMAHGSYMDRTWIIHGSKHLVSHMAPYMR